MESTLNVLMQDRKQAGMILSHRLTAYRNTQAVLVGMPYGGVCVASSIADELHLPIEIMPCRKIQHPSNSRRTLGSVTATEVFLHDCSRGIPQDYISRQIELLREEIIEDVHFYYQNMVPMSLKDKTVIVVDDILENCDTLRSGIISIRKQQPNKIIVAAPVIISEAARMIQTEVDEVIFIHMVEDINLWDSFFIEFPVIKKEEVRAMMLQTRSNFYAT